MNDKKAKILIVEDDAELRRTIGLWLAAAGHDVFEAADGLEGMDAIRAERPDAVLLDLRLPRLDGFGVLEALGRLEGGAAPPVLVISGQDEIDGVVRAFRMGAADYLPKPIVSFDLLDHALGAILERRALSRAVRRAERRYFNLVQNLPLLVYVLDEKLEMVFVNRHCRAMLGYSRTEALSEPGWLLGRVHPGDRERVEACLRAGLNRGAPPRTEECRLLHKNGATLHVLLRAMPAPQADRNGEPATVEGIVIDITDRVELERFVVQDEKLKTLGAISSEVAHEIRNPLFAIAGFAHRLQARQPGNREADIILSEARRLEDILNKISKYLHPVDLRPRQCSLAELVGAALDFLTPEFAALGVAATPHLAPGLPDLRLDPDLLTQVVTSLVRYAARSLPRGGEVRLGTSRHARFVHLDVAFTPKTPVAQPEILFLPFEEGEAGTGLALAHRFVKNMGGSLGLSQDGEEAVFTLQLPADASPEPADDDEADDTGEDA